MIYLVRHGETESNAAGVVQWPSAALSARGREQAQRLGERFAGLSVARVLASDYARAQATAQPVLRATGAELCSEPLLRERHFGALRGRSYAELRAEGIAPFGEDYAPPGGESWPQFRARVARAWRRALNFAADTPGDLAIITHGMVCAVLLERHAPPAPNASGSAPPWRNTGVSILEGPPWRATLFNCTAHLPQPTDSAPV